MCCTNDHEGGRHPLGEEYLASRLAGLTLKKHIQKVGLLLHRLTLIDGRKICRLFYWPDAPYLQGPPIKSAVPVRHEVVPIIVMPLGRVT